MVLINMTGCIVPILNTFFFGGGGKSETMLFHDLMMIMGFTLN